MGHIVHSGASAACNGDVLFFILGVGGTSMDSTKKTQQDTLCRTCVFAPGGICGSHSAFQCIRGMKYRRTISHARVDLVQFL
jgi:hypothetical protein